MYVWLHILAKLRVKETRVEKIQIDVANHLFVAKKYKL